MFWESSIDCSSAACALATRPLTSSFESPLAFSILDRRPRISWRNSSFSVRSPSTWALSSPSRVIRLCVFLRSDSRDSSVSALTRLRFSASCEDAAFSAAASAFAVNSAVLSLNSAHSRSCERLASVSWSLTEESSARAASRWRRASPTSRLASALAAFMRRARFRELCAALKGASSGN